MSNLTTQKKNFYHAILIFMGEDNADVSYRHDLPFVFFPIVLTGAIL